MKSSLLTSIVICLLFVSGCTSAPRAAWQKAGISEHDTNNAIQKCRYNIGLAKVNSDKEQSLFNSCMESEGYRYR